MTTSKITFRAIAMLSDAYCGSQIRVREQGLRWLSRHGNFGSEIVIARDDAAGCSVKFEISQHYERKGCIEAPSAAQTAIIERLQAAGVLVAVQS